MRRIFGPLALLASSVVLGEIADIPLANWTVPPYRTNGVTTMTDQTPPRVFIGLQPCRLLDTRNNLNPLGGGGPFAANQIRTYALPGNCGIPVGTDAVSLNITVTNTISNPFGHIKVWPSDQAEPNVSTLNWATGSVTESNAAIVALSVTPAGQLNVKSGNAGCDVIMDVNGYFSEAIANQGNYLELDNNYPGFATAFFRNSANVNNSMGVYGLAGPSFSRPVYQAAGVRGEGRFGTLGISQEFGAAGSLVSGGNEVAWGILGFNVSIPDPEIYQDYTGVFGYTGSAGGGDAGVVGYAPALTGLTYGVHGLIGSQSLNAAGVRGQDGGGPVPLTGSNFYSAGLRGESHTFNAVLGVTDTGNGVSGSYMNNTSSMVTGGTLGCSTTYGLCVFGATTATGMTSFIEPHPTDASKMIRYISLGGNESGTYFRGRGRFQNGIATIEVPEDFRIVTDPEGLSIQVTPIGEMATVAVQSIGLDRIVVRGSRNVEFFYLVNGVRHAYKDAGPIAENEKQFIPTSPNEPMPVYLPDVLRQRLVSNGTYRPDGTVNMETARRLGWDRFWEERPRPAPQLTEP